MPDNDSLERKALTTLLRESLQRPADGFAFFLNPGDPGFAETMRSISAQTASTPPAPGRKPIVAHCNHVLYGIELANRALAGESDVYESANWDIAWQLESVTIGEWQNLIKRFDEQSQLLLDQVNQPREWNELLLTGCFSIAAHTAYHLGAIRQILRDLQ